MRFYDNCTVILQGPSGCGKTAFLCSIIKEREAMFFTQPTKYIYIYSNYQPIYDKMKATGINISFRKNFPLSIEYDSQSELKCLLSKLLFMNHEANLMQDTVYILGR